MRCSCGSNTPKYQCPKCGEAYCQTCADDSEGRCSECAPSLVAFKKKRCTKCGKLKLGSAFYSVSGTNRTMAECKDCFQTRPKKAYSKKQRNIWKRDWVSRNKTHVREYMRKYAKRQHNK